jgi:hypothetical protein
MELAITLPRRLWLGKDAEPMKFDNLVQAAYLLGGAAVLGRVLTNGFEQAIFATMIEWAVLGVKAARRFHR